MLGSDELTPIGNKTVVNSLFTKENPNKTLFHVPLQHMGQDFVENEFRQSNRQAGNLVCLYLLYSS